MCLICAEAIEGVAVAVTVAQDWAFFDAMAAHTQARRLGKRVRQSLDTGIIAGLLGALGFAIWQFSGVVL